MIKQYVNDVNEAKKIILAHQLHFNSGGSGIYNAIQRDEVKAAVIYFNDTLAVGCGLLTDSYYTVEVYVKPRYRKRGFGREIFKTLMSINDVHKLVDIHVSNHSQRATKFYSKVRNENS